MKDSSYDVLIVGGGLVGLTCGCLLAKNTSLSIAVLEEKSDLLSREDHRVSAISWASQRIFQSLSAWEIIREKGFSPFMGMDVFDVHQRAVHFDRQLIATPALGFIIENQVIQSALRDVLARYSTITYLSPITLTALSETMESVVLKTADEQTFIAKLAIAADGANSWLRQHAGIEVERDDYQQEAIVATVTTAYPHEQRAQQVFLESGPLAFLPLKDACVESIVWSMPNPEAKIVMALDDDHFKKKLAEAFSYRLGEVIHTGKRYSFPLYRQYAKRYIALRVALIGDAAHTVHPLAGQGVNLGLLDAASLAEVIEEAIAARRDFSSATCLRRYERWRKADNFPMLMGIHHINNIFSRREFFSQTLRSLGMNVVHRSSWVKKTMMHYATGHRRGLPKVAETNKIT